MRFSASHLTPTLRRPDLPHGQPNLNCRALVHAFADRLDGPTVGCHQGGGYPKSQAEARRCWRVTISTEELPPQQRPIVGVKPSTLVNHRYDELAGFAIPADADGGLRWRIFRRVIENLPKRSLHQHRIYAQQRKFLWKRYFHGSSR